MNLAISYDFWLMITSISIVALGLLMVASASMVVSDHQYGYPFHFLLRQAIFLGVGVFAAWVVVHIPLQIWLRMSGYLLLMGLVLLVLVLIPGIGHMVNGSRRWLKLGPISVQVSELVKLTLIVYLAGYLTRQQEMVRTQMLGFIKPMILLSCFALLLLLEPDFGATTVIMGTALVMMYMAGVRIWQYAVLLFLVVAVLALLAISAPYRLHRLTSFLHPWANQFGSGYQLTQALIAFGRGGVWGVGLGNSLQKLFYLPEAHTDFLYAVLVEELGLVGGVVVVILFAILVARTLQYARSAHIQQLHQQAYLAYGLATSFALQAAVNMGVNMGLLPTKGLTLPLMSYGGSSIVINCVNVALLLRVAIETNGQPKSKRQQLGAQARVRYGKG